MAPDGHSNPYQPAYYERFRFSWHHLLYHGITIFPWIVLIVTMLIRRSEKFVNIPDGTVSYIVVVWLLGPFLLGPAAQLRAALISHQRRQARESRESRESREN